MNNVIKRHAAGIAALAIGISFMGIGGYRGEVATVMKKAAAICLECIGIG
jgi:hypothetical protein